jgi:hypothetical protein
VSGTIRSRMEAQRDRHVPGYDECGYCYVGLRGPCPDRVAADDTLTELDNLRAKRSNLPIAFAVKLIDPDPDSRGWPMPKPPPYPADDENAVTDCAPPRAPAGGDGLDAHAQLARSCAGAVAGRTP